MRTPHGGTQATSLEQARVDAPIEYIQESQEPTVALTLEQMSELEAQLQNNHAPQVLESENTDPKVATAQTAGLAQSMAEHWTSVEATLGPLTTEELKQKYCVNESEMTSQTNALKGLVVITQADAPRPLIMKVTSSPNQ